MIILILKNFFIKELFFFDIILIFFLNIIMINTFYAFFVKNPIYSLLILIINYIIGGFLFLLNGFIFLGFTFMLIYVGAVSILLLFTFMLINLKLIYYNNVNKNYFFYILFFVFFLEFFMFFVFFKNNTIIFREISYSFNWFDIVEYKNDLSSISYELYLNNSIMLLLISLILLMALLASVNIVNSLKNSKKQEAFIQLKNYTKNVIT